MNTETPCPRKRVKHNPSLNFDELPDELRLLTRSWARFDPRRVREEVLRDAPFDEEKLVRILDKPLDVRWAYVETASKLWNESREDLVRHAMAGVDFLLARPYSPRADDGAPVMYSSSIGNQAVLHKAAYYIPLRTVPKDDQASLFDTQKERVNVSDVAREWLAKLEIDPDAEGEDVWYHALAIGFASRYLDDSADAIRADWPRLPLPDSADLLRASARLGRRVATLLDLTQSVVAVDTGATTAPLSRIGLATRVDGGTLDPDAGDLDVTAGWGYVQRETVVMPGAGRVEIRPFGDGELGALAEVNGEQLMARGETVDVYLNDVAMWRNVPADVWEMRIGGFQVAKKWLSYRDRRVLGRSLTTAEVREFTSLVRRLAAIVLLGSDLNRNYLDICQHTYPWAS